MSALWRSLITYTVHVNRKEWADQEGVAYVTARRWFAAGKLPVPARKVSGLILVSQEEPRATRCRGVRPRIIRRPEDGP